MNLKAKTVIDGKVYEFEFDGTGMDLDRFENSCAKIKKGIIVLINGKG